MDGRSYRVYVRAVNAKGVSSPSPVLSIIAADLPVESALRLLDQDTAREFHRMLGA